MSSTRVVVGACSRAAASIGSMPSCADTSANDDVTPRCVTGMPAAAGTDTADVTPGTTSTGTPAARQASASSPPRPSTNGSPPLSRTTSRPRRARSTMHLVDLVLGEGVVAGRLAAVDHLDVGGQVLEHAARREPVDDDDVGLGEQRAPAHGDQPRVAGTAADQVHVPTAGRCRRRVARTGSSPVSSAAATASRSARGPARVAAAVDRDDDAVGAARDRRASRRGDAAASSARTHQMRAASHVAATASSVGRSPVAVCTSHAPSRSPSAYSRTCQRRRAGRPRATRAPRTATARRRRPRAPASTSDAARARRDRAAADDERPATGEVEEQRVGGRSCVDPALGLVGAGPAAGARVLARGAPAGCTARSRSRRSRAAAAG